MARPVPDMISQLETELRKHLGSISISLWAPITIFLTIYRAAQLGITSVKLFVYLALISLGSYSGCYYSLYVW